MTKSSSNVRRSIIISISLLFILIGNSKTANGQYKKPHLPPDIVPISMINVSIPKEDFNLAQELLKSELKVVSAPDWIVSRGTVCFYKQTANPNWKADPHNSNMIIISSGEAGAMAFSLQDLAKNNIERGNYNRARQLSKSAMTMAKYSKDPNLPSKYEEEYKMLLNKPIKKPNLQTK